MSATTEADDGAIGKDDLQAQNVVAGDAIFEAARSSGIGGDVAAKRIVGATGRIRGIEQPALFHDGLKFGGIDERLDNGDKVGWVDFQNFVQSLQRKGDAAMHGDSPANITMSAAAGGDRNLMPVGKAQYGGHRLSGTGQGHGVRLMGS